MSDVYKLQYNGMTLSYPGWNGAVSYESAPAFKTLTLCAAEGGTLTADSITGMPGDTVQLSTAYNTYWRFSGYAKAGDGTLSNNTYTFGEDDEQIVSAYFKKNTFTATGGWEKGSNVSASVSKDRTTAYVPAKYATHGAHTGDIPASWYSASNRWNPSNASAYSINLKPVLLFSARDPNYSTNRTSVFKAITRAGSTTINSWTYNSNPGKSTYTQKYAPNLTNTTQSTYSISGSMDPGYYSKVYYWASGTTGTWTATGYAP